MVYFYVETTASFCGTIPQITLLYFFRTVHYIAGPGIGYRIVKSGKDPYIPAYFPTIPSMYDTDFVGAGSIAFSPDDSGSDDIFKSRSLK